jgi:hypothetical protein
MDNTLSYFDVPLELFGGLNTELSPQDIPPGVSPDCQDVAFLPGSVFNRPSLHALYETPLPNNVAVNYVKTFLQTDGNPRTLFLGGDGKLWSEDVNNNPGDYDPIGTVSSGLLANSFTAFGKEFLSFHDGFRGQEIPRQFDGINLDRVSQDGPAVNTIIATDLSSTTTIVNAFQSASITNITEDASGICTVTFPVAHGLVANQKITVSNVTPSAYNGIFTILSVPTPTTLTYINTTFGLGTGTGASAAVALGSFVQIAGGTSGASESGNTCTITTTTVHGLSVGSVVNIVGVTASGYNGTFTVSGTPTNTTFTYTNPQNGLFASGGGSLSTVDTNVTTATPHGLVVGDTFVISGVTNTNPPVAISNINLAASVAITATSASAPVNNVVTFTYTTASAHGLSVGDTFLAQGVVSLFYNQIGTVLTVPSSTSITCVVAGNGTPPNSSGGTLGPALATIITAAPNGVTVGDAFSFTGSTSSLNNDGSGNNPSNWVVNTITNSTTFTFKLANQFGGVKNAQFATFGGLGGTLVDGNTASFVNGTWSVSKVIDATHFQFLNVTGVSSGDTFATGGTINGGGQITAGTHNFVVMFLTRNGYITAPSPVGTWNCGGNKQVQLTNIPTGPANITARIIAFTPTGGANYFYIPINVAGGNSTIIADNTTTSFIANFSDNTLMSSIGIDVDGNNLFNQVPLGPNAGGFAYGDRTLWWGERNKVQNLVNMGFDGGSNKGVMLGWTINTPGGLLVNTGDFGGGWQITGDGSASFIGQIQQTAYQDQYGINILQPNTAYTFVCFASVPVLLSTGTIVATLTSVSTSYTSTASIDCKTLTVNGGFVQDDFSVITPASIPSDLVLSVATQNTLTGAVVILDELELVPTLQPFADTQIRFSYVINPEAFDDVTGLMSVGRSNGQPIRSVFTLRDNLYIVKSNSIYTTTDNGQEPASWPIATVSNTVGALSRRAVDVGDDWAVIADRGGLHIFNGGDPIKVSQEIQSLWDRINWKFAQTVWVRIDPLFRRIYVAVPLDDAVSPSVILVLDYRELNTSGELQSGAPIHISYSGKMIASDLTRKWTVWNITANCGAMIVRSNGLSEMIFGGGNGVGLLGGFGNLYFLDPTITNDDDYGQINSYYTTSFFVNHDTEQQLGVGSHRKLFTYLTSFVSGVGLISITPIVNQITNVLRPTSTRVLSQNPTKDIEWPLNVTGERTAFKIQPIPIFGPNLILDSNGTLGTFDISGIRLSFNPTAGAQQGGGWQFIGDGNAASFAFAMSDIINVVPGQVLTLSGAIDASQVNASTDPGSLPFWAVEDPRLSTAYDLVQQQAGVNGRVTSTFTVPDGVTQCVVICDTNNAIVNNGGVLTFSNPQLELGTVATPYQPRNTNNAFNLNKLVVTLRQDPWMPVRGSI